MEKANRQACDPLPLPPPPRSTLQARLDVGRTAFSTLAKKNYRLVVAIAKKYVASSALRAAAGAGGGGDTLGAIGGGAHGQGGTPLEDVVAAGMEGLVTAIRKYQVRGRGSGGPGGRGRVRVAVR